MYVYIYACIYVHVYMYIHMYVSHMNEICFFPPSHHHPLFSPPPFRSLFHLHYPPLLSRHRYLWISLQLDPMCKGKHAVPIFLGWAYFGKHETPCFSLQMTQCQSLYLSRAVLCVDTTLYLFICYWTF